MKTLYITLWVLSGFWFNVVMSQQIQVLDYSDLQPISQVSVTNQTGTQMTVTDLTGRADISGFKPEDSLHFTHIAYKPVVVIKSGIPVNNQIFMVENIIKLD